MMRTPARTTTKRRTLRAERRGVAMLLVIIALGAATVLTSAYLSSRRNSGLIGRNAATSASAQWAANSAAELAVASMQTDANWRVLVSDGVLFDNVALSGAAVAALVTNLEGDPPTASDADVVVTGVAAIDGVTATSQRIVSTIPDAPLDEALNPHLDEFAVYVTDELTLGRDAVLANWPEAPGARLSPPVKVGASSRSASVFDIATSAHAVQVYAYLPPNPPSGMVAMAEDPPFVGMAELAMDIPVLEPGVSIFDGITDHTPGGSGSSLLDLLLSWGWRPPPGWGGAPTGNLRYTGSSGAGAPAAGRYNDLTVENGAVATLGSTLASAPSIYSFDDVVIRNDGVLRIAGVVRMQVRDALEIVNGACVELANDASRLEVVLHGEGEIDDAGVGVSREIARDSGRSLEDVPAGASARSIRIMTTLAGPDIASPLAGPSDTSLLIDNGAIVVAAIHAPDVEVDIDDDSIVIGRVTASEAQISDGAALLYDPSLDNRAGFTSARGPLYTVNGAPIDGLLAALAGMPGDMSIEAMPAHVESYLDTLAIDPSNITKRLIDDLVTGGGAPGDESARAGVLAEPIIWPVDAFSLEVDAVSATDAMKGVFVEIDPVIANHTIVATDLITKAADEPTVKTLDRVADPIEPIATFDPN